jgi:hypothetical protein
MKFFISQLRIDLKTQISLFFFLLLTINTSSLLSEKITLENHQFYDETNVKNNFYLRISLPTISKLDLVPVLFNLIGIG